MRLVWHAQAEADLLGIFDHLLDRDPQAALQLLGTIRHQIERLAEQPGLGRAGRIADTRELIIARTPYIAAYTVDRGLDAVIVLRVLHHSRMWPTAPFENP